MVIRVPRRIAIGLVTAGATSLFAAGAMAALDAGGQPSFSTTQAEQGQAVYAKSCAACHGAALEGKVGPALSGAVFDKAWRGKTLKEFFDVTAQTMPQTAPGSLSDADNLAVTAFILSKNGHSPSAQAMTKDNLGVVLRAPATKVAAAPAAGGDGHPPPGGRAQLRPAARP